MRLGNAKIFGSLAIIAVLAFSVAMTDEPEYSKANIAFAGESHTPVVTGEKSRGTYDAYVKIYIIEPYCDRWHYFDDSVYDNAFLDFAYENYVELGLEETLTESIVWSGPSAGYYDITEDNIFAVAAVFRDEPTQAYGDPPTGNPFMAYLVDAAAAASPTESFPDKAEGAFTHNVFMEEVTATW